MRTEHRLSLGLLLAITLAPAVAQVVPNDHPEVMRLVKATKAVRTVSATFTQEKRYRFMTSPILAPGTFLYERPDKFRWHVEGDPSVVIMARGERVRVAENGQEKRLNPGEQKAYASVQGIITRILSGELLESELMAPRYALDGEWIVLTLTPQEPRMARRIEAFVLRFDREKGALRVLETQEKDGDRTVVRFERITMDGTLPAGVFTDL